jgi:hypothetical protein
MPLGEITQGGGIPQSQVQLNFSSVAKGIPAYSQAGCRTWFPRRFPGPGG